MAIITKKRNGLESKETLCSTILRDTSTILYRQIGQDIASNGSQEDLGDDDMLFQEIGRYLGNSSHSGPKRRPPFKFLMRTCNVLCVFS